MNSARNSLILCLLFLTCCAPLSSSTGRDESRPAGPEGYFQGFDGALVLYQLSEDRTFRYNPTGARNVCCLPPRSKS